MIAHDSGCKSEAIRVSKKQLMLHNHVPEPLQQLPKPSLEHNLNNLEFPTTLLVGQC